MGQNYRQVTFDGSTAEADRTVEFGALTIQPRNEISLKVVDSNGDEVPRSVAGTVGLSILPPDSDRAEASTNDLDLSTGARTFTPFFRSVRSATFSVTGLAVGNRVVVTYYKLPS